MHMAVDEHKRQLRDIYPQTEFNWPPVSVSGHLAFIFYIVIREK